MRNLLEMSEEVNEKAFRTQEKQITFEDIVYVLLSHKHNKKQQDMSRILKI